MARTTGYTATVTLRMLAEGLYDKPGITVPEFLGTKEECVRFVLDGLEQRGIKYRHEVTPVEAA